jgi:antitoxin component YwqK of YwqJK toxin-antitoxin module
MHRKIALLPIFLLTLGVRAHGQYVHVAHDSIYVGQYDNLVYWKGDSLNAEFKIEASYGSCIFYVEFGYESHCKTYNHNGSLSSENIYKPGTDECVRKNYNSNGILISEENYTDGELNGKCTYYYENGTIESKIGFSYDSSLVKSDLLMTSARKDIETGEKEIIYTISPSQSQPDGNWIFYARNGTIYKVLNFDRGRLIRFETGEVHN